MCPFLEKCEIVCPPELHQDRYKGCARYRAACEAGIDAVPKNMKPIDYALVPAVIAGKAYSGDS